MSTPPGDAAPDPLATTRQWVIFDIAASHPAWQALPALPATNVLMQLVSWRNLDYELLGFDLTGALPNSGQSLVSDDHLRT